MGNLRFIQVLFDNKVLNGHCLLWKVRFSRFLESSSGGTLRGRSKAPLMSSRLSFKGLPGRNQRAGRAGTEPPAIEIVQTAFHNLMGKFDLEFRAKVDPMNA